MPVGTRLNLFGISPSSFSKRLSFRMLHFVKKRSQNCPTMKVGAWRYFKLHRGSMREAIGDSSSDALEKSQAVYIWKVKNCKIIYFELKLEAMLFLHALKQNFMKIEFQNSIRQLAVYRTSKLLE